MRRGGDGRTPLALDPGWAVAVEALEGLGWEVREQILPLAIVVLLLLLPFLMML